MALAMSDIQQNKRPILSAIYTIAEAARLCGLSTGRVRRWVRGYSFRRGEDIRSSPPVVRTPRQISEKNTVGLDFLDLIEIRYVKAFVEAGVSWHVLRAAHGRASEMLRVDRPFATEKFFTDGQTILTQIAEPAFLDLDGKSARLFPNIKSLPGGRRGPGFRPQ